MNPLQTFVAGIAPEHAPALVAGLVAAVWLGGTRWRAPTTVDRWAGVLLGVSAAVHLALPLNAHHGPVLSAGFVVAGAGYAVLAWRALRGRSWRLPATLLLGATLVGYLAVLSGGEEPDQVGIAVALVELTALGLALLPGARPGRPRRIARFAGSATTVAAVVLVGVMLWLLAFAAHSAAQGAADAAATSDANAEHSHSHQHGGRAQAGMIMRPVGADHHATEAQRQAAAELAAQTAQATRRYADLDVALADGYGISLGRASGTDVHLEHQGRMGDGATLDPDRPEMLVYAIDGGRATLLGVVYVMEVAGRPGPQPGGPITRWHAHNLCLSALPPGFGVVSPYGGWPALSVAATSAEMMHVWVVDNPAGPFAESLDEAWIRAYHSEHGRSYTADRCC